MIAKNEKPRWSFYLLWILLTFVCVPIAFFLDLAILRILIHFIGDTIYVDGVRHITEDYLGMVVFIPTVALLTGAIQYGLLRRRLPGMGGWVAVTFGGWLLGFILNLVPAWLQWSNPLFKINLAFIVMGLSIGVCQWLLLRRRFPRAGWWLAATLVGWGVLALIPKNNSIGQFGLFFIGFLPACATACGLAWLLGQVRRTEPLSA
jgi:hypothetical protein